ncbi:hypothetical protein [Weissella muntiaci]|uniref:hypothetical protein n=1 Tax=Weissella muntiaci TaxID=2508881 RepID=UPI001CA36456|nr:hypothetical protein [Weissella muntiaci]
MYKIMYEVHFYRRSNGRKYEAIRRFGKLMAAKKYRNKVILNTPYPAWIEDFE